ncbi:MAG: hypothetical protein JKY48_20000 [Flavobacteriales bacterium]|nr:hypothetical protein [Flavobacteriales bacterium]
MFKQIATLILTGISFSCFAQRSMPIEKLQPIIELLQVEANILLTYEVSTQSALLMAKKGKIIFNDFLTYQNKDSTFVLFLSKKKQCKLEYLFLNDNKKPHSHSIRMRALDDKEAKLLDLKENLIQKAEVLSEDSIKAEKGFELHSLLIPLQEEYRLYYLTATNKDSLFPSGNDYLFVFNKDRELVDQTHLLFRPYSLKREDQTYGSKILGISYPLDSRNGLSSLPIYICKFRIYNKNIGISEFRASWDRRHFTYNAGTNQLKIHLFYNEKMSPKYRK